MIELVRLDLDIRAILKNKQICLVDTIMRVADLQVVASMNTDAMYICHDGICIICRANRAVEHLRIVNLQVDAG